jgi:hypothetical protein
MSNFLTLITLQLISCAFMTGLIWTIQLLHYPAFKFIAEDQFKNFHLFHSRNITFIVLPIMLLELVTAIILAIQFSYSKIFLINIITLLLIWACTFFLSVPLHNSLSGSMNINVIDRLVLTNWPRTFLWSMRLILLAYFIFQNLKVSHVNISQ